MLTALLAAVVIDLADQQSRARAQELQGRLGLRGKPKGLTGAAARWAWAYEHFKLDSPGITPDLKAGDDIAHVLSVSGIDVRDTEPRDTDAVIPWFAREFTLIERHGREDRIGEDDVYDGLLPDIIDWITGNPDVDIMAYSLREAATASGAWHEQLRAIAEHGAATNKGVVVVEWPDGSSIQRLIDKASLAEEGRRLGHCVGGYWPEVRGDRNIIFSYRDENNRPLMTIDITGSPHRDPEDDYPGLTYNVAMRADREEPNAMDRWIGENAKRLGGYYTVRQIKAEGNQLPGMSRDPDIQLACRRVIAWIYHHLKLIDSMNRGAIADTGLRPTLQEETYQAIREVFRDTSDASKGSRRRLGVDLYKTMDVIGSPNQQGLYIDSFGDEKILAGGKKAKVMAMKVRGTRVGQIIMWRDHEPPGDGPYVASMSHDIDLETRGYDNPLDAILASGFLSHGAPLTPQTQWAWAMPPKMTLEKISFFTGP